MVVSGFIHGRAVSALIIACAMAMFSAHPVAAQTAKKLKCNGCVKSKQIGNNQIKSTDIRDGTVRNADLANNAVDGAKIAGGAVSLEKLSPAVQSLINASGTGDITGVTAGTGLSGGGDTGDVTLNVNFGGNGNATTASRSNHTHSGASIDDGTVGNADIANNAVTGAKVQDESLTAADLIDGAGVEFDTVDGMTDISNVEIVVATATITAPTAGFVIASASGWLQFKEANADARCNVTTGTEITLLLQIIVSGTDIDDYESFAQTRVIPVTAGSLTVNLVCNGFQSNVTLGDRTLTLLFVPTRY